MAATQPLIQLRAGASDRRQRNSVEIYPNGPVFGDGSAKIRSGHGQRASVRFFFLGIAACDLPGQMPAQNPASL
jgi:hypothetical protein